MDYTLKAIRQSAAVLTGYAAIKLFPECVLISGEATEEGFYYDLICEQPLNSDLIPLFEEQLRAIIKMDLEVKNPEMMRENAVEFFMYHGQKIKANLVSHDESNVVSLFNVEGYFDYCHPPFVTHTRQITAFKLLEIDRESRYIEDMGNVDVYRIKGTAFDNPQHLKKFVKAADKGKKKDHRVLGRQLDLFSFHSQVAPNSWFWHPKGCLLKENLLDWWRQSIRNADFQSVTTPTLLQDSFADKYSELTRRESRPVLNFETHTLSLAKGRTLQHAWLFKSKLHSYRELPLRYAEFGESFYFTEAAHLKGLLRTRSYHEDTLTIFAEPASFLEEIISCLQLVEKCAIMLGFDTSFTIVSRGKKIAGSLKEWESTEVAMIEALKRGAYDYQHNMESNLDGPKIRVNFIDSLSREFAGVDIAVDFKLPEQLGLKYQGADDEMHTPLMIRTAIFGSIERLIAILIEHYAGKLPLWLSPEHVKVVPVMENHHPYARKVVAIGKEYGLRINADFRHDTLRAKIQAAAESLVPYILIVGDTEEKNGVLTVRSIYTDHVESRAEPAAFFSMLKSKLGTV